MVSATYYAYIIRQIRGWRSAFSEDLHIWLAHLLPSLTLSPSISVQPSSSIPITEPVTTPAYRISTPIPLGSRAANQEHALSQEADLCPSPSPTCSHKPHYLTPMAYVATRGGPSTSAPSDGSRTITVRDSQPGGEGAGESSEEIGRLRLRAAPRNRPRVVWREDVVDNEGMGRKSSKSTPSSRSSMHVHS